MDLFAVVLVTITLLTLCGIFIFIFTCALQPKILRYFHRKKNKTFFITALRKTIEINGDLNQSNLDLTRRASYDHDKRAYLKILERSVRTGRRIQDEENYKKEVPSNSVYSLQQYINKHRYSSTTSITRSTEI